MMLNCLIVDDEPLVLDRLENYVGRTPFLQLAGRAASAPEVLQCLEQAGQGSREEIDLLFIDIQMPQLSGLEFSRLLAERGDRTRVIFTTAFGEYAWEGFRVDAMDYLLKPISYTEFLRVAMKAHDWFLKLPGRPVPVPVGKPAAGRDCIWVRADCRQVRIRLADVLYIEGMKDYVRICLTDGSHVMTQMSLKTMAGLLPKELLVRVHRSYIVNMQAVNAIERGRIIFGKARIPISDSYRDEFMQRLAQRTYIPPARFMGGGTVAEMPVKGKWR